MQRPNALDDLFSFSLCPPRLLILLPAILLPAILAAGCSGGGEQEQTPGTSGDLILLRTEPADNGQRFLNEPVAFDFSNEIDLATADFGSVSFAVFDLKGEQLSEPVAGAFRLRTSPGDERPGRRLEFLPRFPTSDAFDDGGFRPGRRYLVQLVKGDPLRGLGLQDLQGKGLAIPSSFSFTTADGTTPAELFRDTKPGGPRRKGPGEVGFRATPRDVVTGEVELNELGQAAVEIRLIFDQPLNPHSANLPVRIDTSPLTRRVQDRGRIFLQYDDVEGEGEDRWIPAEAELEANSLEGATVLLRPLGVLPNNARIEVIVEKSLEDMSGQSNITDPSHDRVFATFQTDASYELRFDAVVESFLDTEKLDLDAPFLEPLAEVLPGAIRANLDFEGARTELDYEPLSQEVFLNTDFTQITPKNAQPINVSGGLFRFRHVTILPSVVVRATGTKPMVWLVTGDFKVEGKLLVEGGQGMRVNTLRSANIPAAGGVGHCGGGSGGMGSPQTGRRSFTGQDGFGPGQIPRGGGKGGRIDCANPTCGIGSGGGGGSHKSQGDPYFKAKANGTSFVQQKGHGGFGCNGPSGNRTGHLPGGIPGELTFKDHRRDNDFWGSAVDVYRQIRLQGELGHARAGQGGGGGGDFATSCAKIDPNFANDQKGGGGGAGGGILIIKALGDIIVGPSGLISVAGGDGGGGAFAGSSRPGGGGGGGSGGMLVLMAGEKIRLHKHGETYAQNDYNFCLSADGGVGLLNRFAAGSCTVAGKYVPAPGPSSGPSRDCRPAGGMGGLGIIQLMAPPGDPSVPNSQRDGTNTVLDDNILILSGSTTLSGAEKMRYLAWRGMPDGQGAMRDDAGNIVNIGDAEGDMRPSPTLLPAPFGLKSRMRSKWLELGAVNRRMTARGGDGMPRGVELQPLLRLGEEFGPQPFFDGTYADKGDDRQGYVAYEDDGKGGARAVFPTVVDDLEVAGIESEVGYRGQTVLEVSLESPSSQLGTKDRYAHYLAVLSRNGSRLGEFRILGHGAQTLYLSKESGSVPSALASSPLGNMRLKIQAQFFSLFTDGSEGFSSTYQGHDNGGNSLLGRAPVVNLRLGFAFHSDPQKALSSGSDPRRWPAKVGEFLFDMNSATAIEKIRRGDGSGDHFRFVKWDLLFDSQFQVSNDPKYAYQNNTSLSPETARMEIRRLVIPYRY